MVPCLYPQELVLQTQWFHWIHWFHWINVQWSNLSICVLWLVRGDVVCQFELSIVCMQRVHNVCTCDDVLFTVYVYMFMYVWMDCESPCEMIVRSKVHLAVSGQALKAGIWRCLRASKCDVRCSGYLYNDMSELEAVAAAWLPEAHSNTLNHKEAYSNTLSHNEAHNSTLGNSHSRSRQIEHGLMYIIQE